MAEENKQPKQIPPDYAAKLKAARAKRSMQGERRVVSILFCDVVGSTHMAEQLDPEDWAEIMDDAFDYMIAPIYRYEGTVARLMGDAVLAFFGAPLTHEDDPQRAVLAGLDILEAIKPFCQHVKKEFGLDFNVRVGINTGPVVVGEIGSDLQVEYTAMGDAVNLAARMEQTATAGTVQISQHTYKHVAPLFEVEALGDIEIKGKSEAQPSYSVIRPKAEPGRLRGITGLVSPLIGRESEFEAASKAMDEVHQGRGSILMLLGEAGLGKSRLIEELRLKWIKEHEDAPWVETRGVSYDSTRPYILFRNLLRTMCVITDYDSPEDVRRKVEEAIAETPESHRKQFGEGIKILLEFEQTPDDSAVQGEALKKHLFDNLIEIFRGTAGTAPFALVCDDLHWADDASIELLIHLMKLVEEVPILIVAAMRPYRKSPGWRVKQAAEEEYPHRYQESSLNPLNAEQSQELVDSLLDISDLPSELHQLIMRKAEGNPFFVEEVVRTLIDNEFVVRDEAGLHWVSTQRVDDIAIPDNLQGLLAARIDRLQTDVRQTLQLAAVIGRSFYFRVLESISEISDTLDTQLNTLQRVELIQEAARLPELEYIFRHELTRDAAYATILRRQRSKFHLQVGETIEQLFPDKLEEESHRLAHHFGQAKDSERALKYYVLAAKSSTRLYANVEAADHYAQAIKFAHLLEADNQQLIELYTLRGRALELSGQYEQAMQHYQELENLGQERKQPELELAGVSPQATIVSVPTGQYDAKLSHSLTERALILARAVKDPKAEAKALWNKMLVSYFIDSDSEKTIEYSLLAQPIARQHNLIEELAYIVHDSVRPLASLGKFDEAEKAQEESQQLWRDLNNMPMLADNLAMHAAHLGYQGKMEKAIELGEEALNISRSVESLWGQAYTLSNLGVIYQEIGEANKSIPYFEEARPLAEQANFSGGEFTALYLARSFADFGDYENAYRILDPANFNSDSGRLLMGRYILAVKAFTQVRHGKPAEAKTTLEAGVKEYSELNLESINTALVLPIQAEVALANQDYQAVITYAEDALTLPDLKRVRIIQPSMLLFKAQALTALKENDKAQEALAQAQELSEEFNSRIILWRIYAELNRQAIERGDDDEAAATQKKAAAVIDYIAEHTGSDKLTASFLATEEVRQILADK